MARGKGYYTTPGIFLLLFKTRRATVCGFKGREEGTTGYSMMGHHSKTRTTVPFCACPGLRVTYTLNFTFRTTITNMYAANPCHQKCIATYVKFYHNVIMVIMHVHVNTTL
jgi:hypothetical protein